MAGLTDVLQGHRFQTAIAKQAVAGTAETVAEYAIPAYGGIVKPMENRFGLEILDGSNYIPTEIKSQAWSEGTVTFQSFPDSIGRLLTAALGSDTMTGAGADKTHTIVSNNTPQWLTVWTQRPLTGSSVEWDHYTDAFIKSIELQYVAGQLFQVQCEFLARVGTVAQAAPPTITTTNVLDGVASYHTWAGATLKLDLDATPATTAVANLQSFAIHMGYDDANLEWTQNITPDFRDLKKWKVSFSASFLMQDWAAFKATYYGSKTAAVADQSSVPLSGSLDFLVKTGPTVDATKSVQIKLPSVQFKLDSPDPNVDGSGLKSKLTGSLQKPASGQPVTAVVLNQVAAAY